MENNFIKATFEYCTLTEWVPAPYMRKTFTVGEGLKSAELKIAALGFYRLWINGKEITKGLLAPYICNTNDLVYYDTYNVASYLTSGENVVGIMLGNGMHNSVAGLIWKEDLRANRTPPAVSLELKLSDSSGERSVISDDSFKVHPSPILYDDFRTGERYDATLEIDGWNMQGFDDSLWGCAIAAEVPSGKLTESFAEPIRIRKTLKPLSIEKQGDGYLYKFAENSAGHAVISINGAQGQKLELIYGDMLIDGKLTYENVTFPHTHIISREDACPKTVYICRDGEQVYRPSFTFFGFQYVYITGITDAQATVDLLTYELYSSDLEKKGSFECSDIRGNTLQTMAINSDQACFFYYPMDCPHREKNGWAADAAVSADQFMINFGAENSLRQWLDNFRKAQGENGKVATMVPSYGWSLERQDGALWEGIVISMPYDIYTYTQDKTVLEENAHTIFRYLYYLSSILKNGLVTYGSGDWCRPGYYDRPNGVPIDAYNSIIAYSLCVKAAEIFKVLEKEFEAEYATKLADKIRTAIRREFINPETCVVAGECQTMQASALYHNIFDEDEKEKAFKALLGYIKEKDNLLDVGMLGVRVMFHVLAEFGEAELAYNMITDKRFPSFGYIADRGYTTLWEYWFDDNTRPHGSLDHHMFSSISGFFIRELGGINFNFDGSITVKPRTISNLDFVKANCRGVSVKWERENGDVKISVDVAPELEERVKIL